MVGCDLWSDAEDFQGATEITGICGSGIIDAIAEMFCAGILAADGTILDLGARTHRVRADGRTFSYVLSDGTPQIRITQTDVRAIQLAKAALHAGARLLSEHFGNPRVDRIRLAGAFGNHIDVRSAMVLGMIPDCDPTHVSPAGNAAGTGARIALLNRASRTEIERRVRAVVKVETAVEERFQQYFVEAMALPHQCLPYPHLDDMPANAATSPAAATAC